MKKIIKCIIIIAICALAVNCSNSGVKNLDSPQSAKAYCLDLRNGCGYSGLAGEYKEIIESDTPFRISAQRTYNADRFDYEETLIIDFGIDPESV